MAIAHMTLRSDELNYIGLARRVLPVRITQAHRRLKKRRNFKENKLEALTQNSISKYIKKINLKENETRGAHQKVTIEDVIKFG